MAIERTVKYIYPPNFSGTFSPGVVNGFKHYIVHCIFKSDGEEEDEVVKIRRSDLLTPSGNVPSKLAIEKIEGNIDGMVVKVHYNNNNDEIAFIGYEGPVCRDFKPLGGYIPEEDDGTGNGDICITTESAGDLDSYDLQITVRVKE